MRRKRVDAADPVVRAFTSHVEQGDAIHLLGNILQELLDGVRSPRDFERLVGLLKPFPLLVLTREIYTHASQLRNHCRKKGLQASAVDFLITAACIHYGYPLLTTDRDFAGIARHSGLVLL